MIEAVYLLLWVDLLLYAWRARGSGRRQGVAATGLLVLAWGVLSIELVRRGLAAGHWPLTNRYEFALCFLWAIIGVYLLLEASWRERRAGPFALGIALLIGAYAVTRPPSDRAIAPLLPALRSVWLQIHVLTTMLGYAALSLAAALGAMRLVQQSPAEAGGKAWLPPPREIEGGMERAVALGFPWLTLGILSGAIWAQAAWGRYWGWDPKETWALVTWLWLTLVLHVRGLRNWRGRRLALLVVVGFGIIAFTFLGVPWLVRTVRLESLHGF